MHAQAHGFCKQDGEPSKAEWRRRYQGSDVCTLRAQDAAVIQKEEPHEELLPDGQAARKFAPTGCTILANTSAYDEAAKFPQPKKTCSRFLCL